MALNLNQFEGQVFGPSGANHAPGLVPDPGPTAHSPPWFLGDNGEFNSLLNIEIAPTATIVTPPGWTFPPLGLGVQATSDNAASQTVGPGLANIPALVIFEENFGGSNINNGRNALTVFLNMTAPTSPSNTNRFYVAVNAFAQTEVNDSGTAGSPAGVIEGFTSQVQLQSGATDWYAALGAEISMSVNTGASVAHKAYLLFDPFTIDEVQGSVTDTMIWAYGTTGAIQSQTFVQLDTQGGQAPISTTGTVIKLVGSWTIENGFDFGNLTISGNVLQWANSAWFLAGDGNASLNFVSAEGGINFGAANTLFIGGGTSTGTVTPVLTANKPGSTTAISHWMQVILGGSTTGWVPVWGN